ncbi:peptidase S8/S53 domain-containing protein [Pestalotiopsis sp. NC0098]|nr:peptidase S8/S53 domain-containing protein [Pestalotiopsis sp. NC0098]
MYLSAFLSLALLATGSVALPASSGSFAKTKVFEKPAVVPSRWAKQDSLVAGLDKSNATLELRIQLAAQNTDKFHETALNIATPGHELYGKHLSQAEIDAMIAPTDESKSLVLDWLSHQGLADKSVVSSRGNAVTVTASIEEIEKLLEADYETYTNSETGEQIVRTLEYSLPESLDGHVRMVQPTNFFGFRSFLSEDSDVSAAAVAITPEELSTLYNFASSTDAQSNGRMGIAGFLEQWPSKSDLQTFLNRFAIFDNADQTYTCALINGGTCPASPGSSVGVEANLDVQYARAITKDIPNVFYSTGGRPPLEGSGTNTNEPYLEFLEYLQGLDDADLPNTVSISYGDDESTVPLSYADTVCDLFSQLGARGVSITASSGDSSVGTTCKTASGSVGFTTAFPAACPWITSVGGTSGVPEAAWTSGGAGFSEIFGQPSYQSTAVKAWLASNDDNVAKYFNASGRAYPDVSAQATAVRIVVSGSTTSVSGTSCSSPIFASIIQLINSARLADGKSGLGFLNPWLYSNASTGFNDISSGSTTGCRGVITGGAGFSAAAGWDPATGLGTPNFAKLKAISDAT